MEALVKIYQTLFHEIATQATNALSPKFVAMNAKMQCNFVEGPRDLGLMYPVSGLAVYSGAKPSLAFKMISEETGRECS